MNFPQIKKINWLPLLGGALFLLSLTTTLYGMVAELGIESLAAEERAVIGAMEGGAEALATIDRASAKIFNVDAEALSGMSESMRTSLATEYKGALEEIKVKLQGNPNIAKGVNFETNVEGFFQGGKTKLFNEIKTSGRLSIEDANALKKMNLNPAETRIIAEVNPVPFDEVNVPPDVERVEIKLKDQIMQKEEVADIAHSEVKTAHEDLQNAYKTGKTPDEISAARAKVTEAQDAYNTKADTAKQALKDDFAAKQRSVLQSEDELQKTAGKSPQEIKAAKEKLTNAKEDAQAVEKSQKIETNRQLKDKWEQAKLDKASADAELANAKKVFGEKSDEFKTAEKNVKTAEEKVLTTRKELLDNVGFFRKWSSKFGDKMGSIPGKITRENIWKGTKWTGQTFWNHFGQSFVAGFVFTFPNMIMDTIQSHYRNEAIKETLTATVKFGNIWMKIPSDLINDEEPTNSKFVYVGLPTENQKITNEFLKTANYYVAKPEFGALGSSAITDPNFPNVMLHLNTGFIFVGDGQAYDDAKRTVPLLQMGAKEQNLAEDLNELAGEVAHGQKGKTYQYYQIDRPTGYKGNATIGQLFAKPEGGSDAYPPLLKPTVVALQNGTLFGNYSLKGIRGLGGSRPDDKAMWELLTGGTMRAAADDPYIAQGVYVYETPDTPYIKNIRDSLSPDDPQKKALLKDLVDYVIVVDDTYNQVPLEVPKDQPPYNFASYTFNTDVKYMVSLLETNGKYISAKGPSKSNVTTNYLDNILSLDLKNQIKAMKAYCDEKAQAGPFAYGSVKMTVDPTLRDKGIFVYKVPGYLEGGADDYVVALKGLTAIELPSLEVQFFASLVTNRFYDASFNPYTPPVKNSIMTYRVAKVTASGNLFVTTGALSSGTTELYSGKAPLYTLFVEWPYNPNKPPAGTKVEDNDLKQPFGGQWALNNLTMADAQGKPVKIIDFLKEQGEALKEKDDTCSEQDTRLECLINKSHNSWDAALDKKDPLAVTRLMGPFNFTTGLAQNVQIKGVSEDALGNQNFVYFSDSYPDEYLVMATDAQGSNAGQAFGQQQYAVSLSTGAVYTSKPQPEAGKQAGEQVDQAPVDVDAIMNRAQATKPYLPNLLAKIKSSQAVYEASIQQNLYGPNVSFGKFEFYIRKLDYLAGQYIYADITGLGDPLDAAGNEVQAVVSKINDYYVCAERTADSTQKDSYSYSFGNVLNGNTYSVISLISGASYDRNGKYLGTYEQFKIKGSSIVNVLAFTNNVLSIIEKRSGKSVLLLKKITDLTSAFDKNLKQEEKELQDAETAAGALYKKLDGNLKSNLDNTGNKYLDNPNLLPRYIKKSGEKYYGVTPGYTTVKQPEGTAVDAWGPDRTYIDYNLGVGTDSGKGMIYDANGNASILLKGFLLVSARAYAGVSVDAQGKQTLTIGVSAPTLPMGKTKPDEFLVATGFDTIRTNAGVTFDFYYHMQVDSYFVKISAGSQKYYVNLSSGYGYNLDGTPRWFESLLYATKTGELLLIGTDAFGVRKVAIKRPEGDYNFYTMVGGFDAEMVQEYKIQGTYYEMIDDSNPDKKVRLLLASRDLNGNPLPQPFYLVWDLLEDNSFKLVNQFFQDTTLRYSLLFYTQTREGGKVGFVPSDNYIDAKAQVLIPKTVGIIFDANQKITAVFYANQVCNLNGTAASYKAQDGTMRSISVKQNNLPLQQQGISATWLTIADGAKSYDYLFDNLILNPDPEVIVGSDLATHLNLYELKRGNPQALIAGSPGGGFALNVSNFVPSSKPIVAQQGQTDGAAQMADLAKPVSGTALVSILRADQPPGAIKFPPTLAESFKSAPNDNLSYISLDNIGKMFIYNRVQGKAKRFVYALGQKQDSGQSYYTESLNGWSVDLSTGILYDQNGFPPGAALMPTQLKALLDILQISVTYDAKGEPGLAYRSIVKAEPTQK